MTEPLSIRGCDRCGALTPCTLYAGGLLALCPACPLYEDCGTGLHPWHGSPKNGTWVCLQCGSTLTDGEITSGGTTQPAQHPYADIE
jgi:hypothetical protein